jgi:hypothetical protein
MRAVGAGMSTSEETDWQVVHNNLVASHRQRGELDCFEARCLRDGLRLKVWWPLGHPTMLAYMEDVLGQTPRAAAERLRVAKALADLPTLEHALANGRFSYSAIRELTRVATKETETDWLAATINRNVRDIERMVAGREPGDRPDSPVKPELILRNLLFRVKGETFALYRETKTKLQEEVGHALDDEAFLGILLRRALEGSSGENERARHQMAVTVCESCKRGWQDGGGVAVEIDAKAIELAKCDAEHIGSIDAASPARAKQDIAPAVRRLVWRRDHGACRMPGCRSARNLDIHHIVPRERGGSSECANLILCCTAHHQAIHDGILIVTGTSENLDVSRKPGLVETATRALVGMGFRKKDAGVLVDEALTHVGKESLPDLVKEALRCTPLPPSTRIEPPR